MNKTHWPNTLLIFVKDQIIGICNILQLNTILFWFASDKIHFSVFQCNELINNCVWKKISLTE